jgi:hypothetical protein
VAVRFNRAAFWQMLVAEKDAAATGMRAFILCHVGLIQEGQAAVTLPRPQSWGCAPD